MQRGTDGLIDDLCRSLHNGLTAFTTYAALAVPQQSSHSTNRGIMPTIPNTVRSEHVVQAIEALRQGLEHDFGESRDYDVLHNGNRYPPKAVIGIAAEYATGQRLHPADFSSGVGSGQACRFLHDLGFRIVTKNSENDVFDVPRFVPGEVIRRQALHDRYDGQRQGGISTPNEHPIVFLITGESGAQYGYADGFRDDGSFWYTGEGQIGDMEMARGNAAILNHRENAKTLHIFRVVRRGHLQYIGEAEYMDHHTEAAPDRDGNPRRAIVFELSMRVGTTSVDVPSVSVTKPRERSSLWSQPLAELRKAAVRDLPSDAPSKERKSVARQRSEEVRFYVLRRADGTCEGCGKPAPFETADGKPYLEPHHTRRLADGGPDHPRWVAALCPNCHRRVHYGADGDQFNAGLIKRLDELEADD